MWCLIYLVAATLACDRYECEDSQHRVPSGACALITSEGDYSTYYFKNSGCPANKECRKSKTSRTLFDCQDNSKTEVQVIPGDKCYSSNYICTAGTQVCVSDPLICEGYPEGFPCEREADCSPGFACIKSLCSKQLKASQKGCKRDSDCQNNLGCHFEKEEKEGTCVEYFTLKSGTKVGKYNCENSTCLLCESGYCTPYGKEYECLSTVTSRSLPYLCNDRDCVGSYSVTGNCTCGYNQNGNSYCSPFFGDPVGQSYISILKDWLGNSINHEHCNAADRFSNRCAQDWWDSNSYEALIYQYIKFNFYALTIDLADCVRVNLLPDFPE